MNLTDFLRKNKSLDIESDTRMINKITGEKSRLRLERLVKNITNCDIKLSMNLFAGSYTGPTKHGIIVNIDPIMFYQPKTSFDELWLMCTGAAAHEAGHIAYSDFDIVKRNSDLELEAKASIPIIAEKLLLEDFDITSPEGKDVIEKLKKAIYDYIYNHQLAAMLNSIEDGAIENIVPSYYTRVYGSIVGMRNFIYEKEQKSFLNKAGVYQLEDCDELGLFIGEIRQYAVIGHRRDIKPVILPDILSQDEIDEIETLCIYGRLATTSTEERNIISKVLLDTLNPLIEKKVEKFLNEYLEALSPNNIDALMDSLDVELNGHTEMTIQGSLDPSLAGKTAPKNITSDYSMDLPQKTMDKINKKLEEKQKQQEQQNSGSGGSGNSQSSSENSDSSESSGEKSNSCENIDKTSDESQSQGSQGQGSDESDEKQEGQEGNSSSSSDEEQTGEANGESNGDDKSGEESGTGIDDGKSQDGEDTTGGTGVRNDSKNDGEVQSSAKGFDKNRAALEAENAYKESLKKIEKSFEKEKATDFKQSLNTKGSGKAPKLGDSLASANSITDCHKGIKTIYYPSNKLNNITSYGETLAKNTLPLLKQSATFSKKLKEILMYQAKTRRKNGLKSGKIHDAALSRIITDQRLFKKTINGIEKKARIAVLLDLSGSMSGSKVYDAMAASYMLADACSRIKVPISIMGHNTTYQEVCLYHFVEFENCFKKEAKNKIFAAEAYGANHDGLAIFHAATDLVRHRKNGEQLILLVISDGAPAGIDSYYGSLADEDIQKITSSFQKQFDVKTIGIGIGDDVAHVPNIYKNFLLVPRVEELGDELLKVLKSILL